MTVLDLLPDAVVRLDAARRIVEVNAAVSRMTGYEPGDLVGQPCSVLRPRSRGGREVLTEGWHPSAYLRSVKCMAEQEVIIRGSRGEDFRAFVAGTYLRGASGSLEGAVVSLRPTESRGHQTASGIEIVSTVAHELRSPLTAVKGYTSLILGRWERLSDDDKKSMLEQVNREADRVVRLITELLDISRLESGRLQLRREMVQLPELARSVVEKVKLEHPELACDMAFPEAFPTVFADPDKIMQVITNLVENACKYASPVGIAVEGAADEAEVAVAVRDRGPGFPDRDLSRVFDKFFRRADTRPTGSGLGLWISKGLVEAHGGRLMVDSRPGQGATFRFTLPRDDLEGAVGG
jgi:PAS domain S-box-containing protein